MRFAIHVLTLSFADFGVVIHTGTTPGIDSAVWRLAAESGIPAKAFYTRENDFFYAEDGVYKEMEFEFPGNSAIDLVLIDDADRRKEGFAPFHRSYMRNPFTLNYAIYETFDTVAKEFFHDNHETWQPWRVERMLAGQTDTKLGEANFSSLFELVDNWGEILEQFEPDESIKRIASSLEEMKQHAATDKYIVGLRNSAKTLDMHLASLLESSRYLKNHHVQPLKFESLIEAAHSQNMETFNAIMQVVAAFRMSFGIKSIFDLQYHVEKNALESQLKPEVLGGNVGGYAASIRNYFQVRDADLVFAITQLWDSRREDTPSLTPPKPTMFGNAGELTSGTGFAVRYWLHRQRKEPTESRLFWFNDNDWEVFKEEYALQQRLLGTDLGTAPTPPDFMYDCHWFHSDGFMGKDNVARKRKGPAPWMVRIPPKRSEILDTKDAREQLDNLRTLLNDLESEIFPNKENDNIQGVKTESVKEQNREDPRILQKSRTSRGGQLETKEKEEKKEKKKKQSLMQRTRSGLQRAKRQGHRRSEKINNEESIEHSGRHETAQRASIDTFTLWKNVNSIREEAILQLTSQRNKLVSQFPLRAESWHELHPRNVKEGEPLSYGLHAVDTPRQLSYLPQEIMSAIAEAVARKKAKDEPLKVAFLGGKTKTAFGQAALDAVFKYLRACKNGECEHGQSEIDKRSGVKLSTAVLSQAISYQTPSGKEKIPIGSAKREDKKKSSLSLTQTNSEAQRLVRRTARKGRSQH